MGKRTLRPKEEPEHDQPQPQLPPDQEQAVALAKLKIVFEKHLEDEMGNLYNRFVAFIAEARLPLPQTLLVLEILMDETKAQARKRYVGD
jgi:hypothetical protein